MHSTWPCGDFFFGHSLLLYWSSSFYENECSPKQQVNKRSKYTTLSWLYLSNSGSSWSAFIRRAYHAASVVFTREDEAGLALSPLINVLRVMILKPGLPGIFPFLLSSLLLAFVRCCCTCCVFTSSAYRSCFIAAGSPRNKLARIWMRSGRQGMCCWLIRPAEDMMEIHIYVPYMRTDFCVESVCKM